MVEKSFQKYTLFNLFTSFSSSFSPSSSVEWLLSELFNSTSSNRDSVVSELSVLAVVTSSFSRRSFSVSSDWLSFSGVTYNLKFYQTLLRILPKIHGNQKQFLQKFALRHDNCKWYPDLRLPSRHAHFWNQLLASLQFFFRAIQHDLQNSQYTDKSKLCSLVPTILLAIHL